MRRQRRRVRSWFWICLHCLTLFNLEKYTLLLLLLLLLVPFHQFLLNFFFPGCNRPLQACALLTLELVRGCGGCTALERSSSPLEPLSHNQMNTFTEVKC